jgi:hypothetical protein
MSRIAEWLLESVTTRERAASTVGDLRETAATRGEAWFWASVLGAAGALLWRGMVAEPRRMLGLAFRGLLMTFVVQLGITTIVFVISAARALLVATSMGLGGPEAFPTAVPGLRDGAWNARPWRASFSWADGSPGALPAASCPRAWR